MGIEKEHCFLSPYFGLLLVPMEINGNLFKDKGSHFPQLNPLNPAHLLLASSGDQQFDFYIIKIAIFRIYVFFVVVTFLVCYFRGGYLVEKF